ncbi:MAG: transporter permease [Marmoricola sp.]|nr:transporter permease [Marmoricola sp.]
MALDSSADGVVDPVDPTPNTGSSLGGRSMSSRLVGYLLARGGLVVALLVAVAFFGIYRPDTFFTVANWQSMLLQSAAPGVLAVSLTIPLAMGDFDLSIGSMLGLGGASAVALMSLHQVNWVLAIIAALLVGAMIGLLNGILIAYMGLSSFVVTLAMATVLVGVEFAFTNQQTIYQGVDPNYTRIGQSTPFLGVAAPFWILLVLAIVLWVLLERTELGRYIYAIGGNAMAARFAGVAVKRIRAIGFVLVATGAAFGGVLLTAQSGTSSPNAGVAYLLPAFAAAFLGSSAFRPGEFNIAGTMVAVIFLQVVGTGLQMLGQSTSFINVVQGVVLIVAMLLSRLGQPET